MSLLDLVDEKFGPQVRGSIGSLSAPSEPRELKLLKEPRPKPEKYQGEHPGNEPVSVDMLARELLQKRRSELQRLAADDWSEVEEDPARLIAFATLAATCQIRASGSIPDTYTATTFCSGCRTEVPIFPGAPDKVDACPWCISGQNLPEVSASVLNDQS